MIWLAIELNPKDTYAALWFDLAECRNNGSSHAAQTAKHLDMTSWPATVVRLYLSELSPANTLAAAESKDAKTKLGQFCEFNVYAGELALLKENRQELLRLLRLAASDCPRSFIETNAAIGELMIGH